MNWSQVRVLAGPHHVMEKFFKASFIGFLVFTLFLLIEGFLHYYSHKLSFFFIYELTFSQYCLGELTQKRYTFFDPIKHGFNPYIWNENGIVETMQIVLILISIINFFKILKFKKKTKIKNFFYYFLVFYFIGILYYFFEEISWGQHYFGWVSLDFFIQYNNQQETNLHNISNLLDQLPRSFLALWCGLSFVFYKYSIKLNLNEDFTKFILPSDKLKYISYLFLLSFLPDFIFSVLFPEINYGKSIKINFADIYSFITFNYIRLSEYHELIFSFYICYHSIFFKKKEFDNN